MEVEKGTHCFALVLVDRFPFPVLVSVLNSFVTPATRDCLPWNSWPLLSMLDEK